MSQDVNEEDKNVINEHEATGSRVLHVSRGRSYMETGPHSHLCTSKKWPFSMRKDVLRVKKKYRE